MSRVSTGHLVIQAAWGLCREDWAPRLVPVCRVVEYTPVATLSRAE